MAESAVLGTEFGQAARDGLMGRGSSNIRVGGRVEDDDPLCTLSADSGRDIVDDDAFDRAERAVQRAEGERVLEPRAGRKHSRDGRRGLTSFERRHRELVRVHPRFAHGLGDFWIDGRRVAGRSRHQAIFLRAVQFPFMNERTESATRSSCSSVSSANMGSESTSDATFSVTGISPLR